MGLKIITLLKPNSITLAGSMLEPALKQLA